MPIDRETQEQLTNLQVQLDGFDNRLEFAERRTQAIRHQNFIDNFLSGLTDLGTLGFISSHLDWKHAVSPPNPNSGFQRIFADTDNSGHLTSRNSSGSEIDLEYVDADAIAAVEGEATLDLTGDVKVVASGKFFEAADFRLDSATELTMDTNGDVAITQSYHRIDTFSDAASDNLDGMSGGNDGAILIIRPENDARTVIVRHNQNAASAENILLAGGDNATLDDISDYMLFIYDVNLDTNGAWIEVSRSTEASAYTDADAIAAVEGEATLALSGAVDITGVLTVDDIDEKTGDAGVDIDGVRMLDEFVELTEITAPGDPAANDLRLFAEDISGTTVLVSVDSAGARTLMYRDMGWKDPDESWSFASSTSITVSSGAASRYTKGDKIKFTQTTVKYFYIVGIADTTLTVTGGSDYTVANAAISANFYSNADNPQGFPLLNWSPGFTGFSADPTVTSATFIITGSVITVLFNQNALGTSDAITFTMTGLPVAAANAATLMNPVFSADNSANHTTALPVDISSTTLTFRDTVNTTNGWTASGTKGCYGFALSYNY